MSNHNLMFKYGEQRFLTNKEIQIIMELYPIFRIDEFGEIWFIINDMMHSPLKFRYELDHVYITGKEYYSWESFVMYLNPDLGTGIIHIDVFTLNEDHYYMFFDGNIEINYLNDESVDISLFKRIWTLNQIICK